MIEAVGNSNVTVNNIMQLKKACMGFEAIMVEKMLESMDKTIPEDPLLKNNAQNSIYKSMYINALSKKIANRSQFGIGNLLFNSLKSYVDYKKYKTKSLKPLRADVDFKPFNNNRSSDIIHIKKIVDEASKKYSVPKKLIYGIIKAESNFNPHALSKAGAVGVMQLMPQTALEMGAENIWNIRENVMAGVKYISSLINRFKNEKMAIAAYNAGPSNVQRYKGVPPFKETKNYVKKVLAYVDNKY